ncbi:Pr6Pr family membrane protein [Streptomyces sp. MS06]|uniref:Pr6Pr family membrane protein n=1 Tax=Streptomyces sp. MS06 TaxID=3385974 RepID=UPI00399FDFA8
MRVWSRASFWWRLAVALSAGTGLVTGTASLVYFTVQSNVIAFGYFGAAVYWMLKRNSTEAPAPRLRGAVTLYLLITALVAHFVLNHGANPLPGLGPGPDRLANWSTFFLHYITPVLVMIDWLVLRPRNASHLRDVPLWLAFPLTYAAVTLARAAMFPHFPNKYPYFFLDADKHGYGWVGLQVLQLTVGFTALALLVVALDRLGSMSAGRLLIRRSPQPLAEQP